MYEDFASRLAEEGGDPSEESELKKIMIACIDTEIESLTSEENLLRTEDRQRIEYKSSAAIIPGPEILDRLLRLETHLSREIDRILNRLERLQRMRRDSHFPCQLVLVFPDAELCILYR